MWQHVTVFRLYNDSTLYTTGERFFVFEEVAAGGDALSMLASRILDPSLYSPRPPVPRSPPVRGRHRPTSRGSSRISRRLRGRPRPRIVLPGRSKRAPATEESCACAPTAPCRKCGLWTASTAVRETTGLRRINRGLEVVKFERATSTTHRAGYQTSRQR